MGERIAIRSLLLSDICRGPIRGTTEAMGGIVDFDDIGGIVVSN